MTKQNDLPYILSLLGAPRLETPSKTLTLEGRLAAVLAYLALEGATSKYKLAGLLWPDSGETAARNNMRQLLRRFRQSTNEDIIVGEDRIELRSDLEVDAKKLSYLETPSLELLKQNAEFLEGMDYDDAPDFAEWLESVREELREVRIRSAEAEATRLEESGNLRRALEFAEARLKLEPFSEEAYRHIMRLYYLLGDRGAALMTFEKCKAMLREELGATPLEETLELARLIERGTQLANAPAKTTNALPTAVLRPPVLAGREAEWEQLETAWSAGQFIALAGEAGSGKTRLMLDFIYSKVPKESVLHLQSRPGDAGIPYSTHARNFKKMIDQFKPDLEPWVVRELARMIPELGDSPGPIISPAEKLRFYQAKLEAIVASVKKGLRVLASDDVQFTDPASGEAALYMMGQMSAGSGGLAAVYCYRPAELNPQIQTIFDQGNTAGLIAMIKLGSLETHSVETLLEGLGVKPTDALVPGLTRYTGGNPQFVLETVKYLMETGRLDEGLPSRLSAQGQVASLIARRLQRLSPMALNLARAAAIAGTQFNLELAAFVLERSPLDLMDAVSELEATQILKGSSFTHDLVFEAVLADIPQAVKQLLHARTARWLENARANPAAIAGHWLEAAQPVQGVPWLLKAAELAEYNALPREAADNYQRAIAVLEANGDLSQAATLGSRLEALKVQALS
jgi:DNA-binding SARP family transcriptional activator